jgi:hypothetical protein
LWQLQNAKLSIDKTEEGMEYEPSLPGGKINNLV